MESLEDISTGGRVTRSLRKRLASVDSDSNSRPSTPQLTKLTVIPEINSPSRSLRGTRRNSVTGNGTPSKVVGRPRKLAIFEENDVERTPAKRNTRRVSVSVEDTQTPKKTLIDNSLPIGNEVDEQSKISSREIAGKGAMRLQSTSPLEFEVEKTPGPGTNKKKKPGPRSRRNKHSNESDSDVEVINLEEKDTNTNSIQNPEEKLLKTPTRTSPRLQAKNISPKNRNISMEIIDLSEETLEIDNMETTEEQINSNMQSIKKDKNENSNLKDTHSNVSVQMSIKETENFENHSKTNTTLLPVDESKSEVSLSIKISEKSDSPKSYSEPLIENVVMIKKLSPVAISKFCGDFAVASSPNSKSVTFNDIDTDDDVIKNTYPKTPASISNSPKSNSKPLIESVVMIKKLSPVVISKFCGDFAVASSPNSKSVTFNDVDTDDDVIKNTYPKTPASIKSKSCLTNDFSRDTEDKSFQSGKESINSFKDANALLEVSTVQADFGNQSRESVEFHNTTNGNIEGNMFNNMEEIREDYTPHKQSLLMNLQSSTPMIGSVSSSDPDPNHKKEIENISSKKSPLQSPHKLHESLLIEKDKTDENLFDVDVNKSVSKIDIANTSKNEEKNDLFSRSWSLTVSGNATCNGKIDTIVAPTLATKNVEVITDRERITDEQKMPLEENEEEEEPFQKLEFVDDEAIEVGDNYESGDSMDAEEREEMLENEIIDEGESIGSKDTLSDNIDEDEEDNSSFITSDSEDSVLEYSDREDDPPKTTKTTKKSPTLSTSGSEVDVHSSDGNKKESANGLSDKKKRLSKSNTRNRILSTSDSEEEPMVIKNTTINNETSITKLDQSLNFEVSRMIDESTDDDVVTNETSEKKCVDKSKQQYDHIENNAESKEFISDEAKHTESVKRSNSLEKLNVSHFADIDEGTECANVYNNSSQLDRSTDNKDIGNTTNTGPECTYRESSSIIEQILDTSAIENKELINNESDREDIENEQNKQENNTSNNSNSSEHESNVEKFSEEEDIEIPETQQVGLQILEAGSSNESDTKETVEGVFDENYKPNIEKSGLSESFCPVKQRGTCVKTDKERKRHSSFTIGVSVTKPENSNGRVIINTHVSNTNSSPTDGEEIDELKHLNLTNNTMSSTNKKRKSMISLMVADISEIPYYKKLKRNSVASMTTENFNPSRSLIETIEDRKHELNKERNPNKSRGKIQNEPIVCHNNVDLDTLVVNNSKETSYNGLEDSIGKEISPSHNMSENIHHKIKIQAQRATKKQRLSQSFCGPIQTGVNSLLDRASDVSSEEIENKIKINSSAHQNLKSTPNKTKDNSHILDKCDEILDAANRAKLESKQNYKKSSVFNVKSKKKSSGSEEESSNKNNMKHSKEKTTQALEQAFKASAKLLMKETCKNKREKLLPQLSGEQYAERRLPMEILESLSNSDSQEEIQLKSRAPLVHRMNCASGEIVEEILSPPKKKRAILNKFELPTGTVFEEPVTPKKKMNAGGFRESPITPRTIGFKVEHIISAGQDKVPESLTSNRLKRKHISDPQRVLPKPQWSQSGVFLEEPLSSINDNKLRKLQGTRTSEAGATVSAIKFKNSRLFRKNVPREASREMLKRKERQYIRNYF